MLPHVPFPVYKLKHNCKLIIFYINRCTRGLTLHTFHGNFFVRSTDLLSLPNVNPDAGFGMQVSIEGKIKEIALYQMMITILTLSSGNITFN